MGQYRVWWKDEFDRCKDQDELDDIAWKVPDERGIFDPERRIPCDDPEDAAKKYAEHFYYHRDGYDDKWPIDFVVGVPGADYVETFVVVNVEMEYEPVFQSADPVPHAPAFAAPSAPPDVAGADDAVRSAGG